MPEMDGLQSTMIIRALEQSTKPLPEVRSPFPCSPKTGESSYPAHASASSRVSIVGVSACSNADQLKSPALQGFTPPIGNVLDYDVQLSPVNTYVPE